MKKFAVFDIDGTLVRWQLYHSIADTLVRLGHIEPRLYQSIKEARMVWKRRAGQFADYERQVVNVYDQIITRLSREEFEAAAQAVFEEYKDQTYTYTRDLIAELKKNGYTIFAISGSQSEIVAKIANYYGFDDYRGSMYEYADGRFTGNKVVAAHHKDKALKQLINQHNVSRKASIAVGDSFSDVAMLEMVENPIAFNPEKRLLSKAKEEGWKIVIERKNVVYELERLNGKYELAASS